MPVMPASFLQWFKVVSSKSGLCAISQVACQGPGTREPGQARRAEDRAEALSFIFLFGRPSSSAPRPPMLPIEEKEKEVRLALQ